MAWTATDDSGNLAYKFGEQPKGSALYLSLLGIHISEVRQKISEGNSTVQGKTHDYGYLNDTLKRLEQLQSEAAAMAVQTPSATTGRASFTRGHPL